VCAATIYVDVQCFPSDYIDKADQLFLRPSPRYKWEEIVSGTWVQSQSGGTRPMWAVDQNTFRGFWRINQACPGAKERFIDYFLERQSTLVGALAAVRSQDDLYSLSNCICEEIRTQLSNIQQDQLRSYNKVRKPVDLYIEHLVAMAFELDEMRATLVPFLFLPLDSQILAHPGLFTELELRAHKLKRKSTYKDIDSEDTYKNLQKMLSQKAEVIVTERHRPFHVIYFDLLWNDRNRNWGGNLFETNPEKSARIRCC
jgi:hypothetical protein